MKKSVVAILIAGSLTATVQAAGQDNTWYAGGKLGWSNFYGVDRDSAFTGATITDESKDDVGLGALVGYQLNKNVGFELGYDWLGKYKYTASLGGITDTDEVSAQLAQLSMKLGIPVSDAWDIYARLGGAYVFADSKQFHNDDGGAFLGALGVEYAINRDWAARFEYQYTTPIGNDDVRDTGVGMDNGLLSLAMVYRFGQAAPVAPTPVPTPAPEPQMVEKQFTLNADVLFDFNKHTLKPEGYSALDSLYEQIKAERPKDGTAAVIGYTDRIGSDGYNKALSEKRAQTVASYLVSKGIPADKVSAEGRGKASPVTGDSCTSKNKRELIVCLAPDRRVEVMVQGVADTQQ